MLSYVLLVTNPNPAFAQQIPLIDARPQHIILQDVILHIDLPTKLTRPWLEQPFLQLIWIAADAHGQPQPTQQTQIQIHPGQSCYDLRSLDDWNGGLLAYQLFHPETATIVQTRFSPPTFSEELTLGLKPRDLNLKRINHASEPQYLLGLSWQWWACLPGILLLVTMRGMFQKPWNSSITASLMLALTIWNLRQGLDHLGLIQQQAAADHLMPLTQPYHDFSRLAETHLPANARWSHDPKLNLQARTPARYHLAEYPFSADIDQADYWVTTRDNPGFQTVLQHDGLKLQVRSPVSKGAP